MKDQVVELLHLMLRRGLIERAERFYTKPKPGRKRLARWPNKLKPVLRSEQVRRSRSLHAAPLQRGVDVTVYGLPPSLCVLLLLRALSRIPVSACLR